MTTMKKKTPQQLEAQAQLAGEEHPANRLGRVPFRPQTELLQQIDQLNKQNDTLAKRNHYLKIELRLAKQHIKDLQKHFRLAVGLIIVVAALILLIVA